MSNNDADVNRERYVRFVIRTRFMHAPWVDSGKLRLTYEGAYSLTPSCATEHMIQLIERETRRQLRACRVLECFAGHGGDTIPLVHVGEPRSIMCFEQNPEHRGNLRHNLRMYFPDPLVRRRITVAEDGDVLSYLRWLRDREERGTYDLMYLDPPWGGHGYKTTERIGDIILYDKHGEPVQLSDLVSWCFSLCETVVLKLPINFDPDAFKCYRGAVIDDYRPAHIRYVLLQGGGVR